MSTVEAMSAVHSRNIKNAHHRAAIEHIVQAVCDPEIPVVTIAELGILRNITIAEAQDEGGEIIIVTITPTYSGCPAMQVIEHDIVQALAQHGMHAVRVVMQHSPAWTTDWITPAAREKLRAYGIAPPPSLLASPLSNAANSANSGMLGAAQREAADHNPIHFPACPQCGSRHTEKLSQFGSTACKALYRCLGCREPFDYFKPY